MEKEIDGERVYSVQDFNYFISDNLKKFGKNLIIEGEVSNISDKNPHVYITLTDSNEKFKNTPIISRPTIKLYYNRWDSHNITYEPEEGDKVIVFGEVILFTKSAQLFFKAERIQPAGEGDILKRLARLKLEWQNTYFARPKRTIPYLVKNIFVITSLQGKAKNDVIKTRNNLNPGVNLFFINSLVQGRGCLEDIANNIARANEIFDDIINDISRHGIKNSIDISPLNTILLVTRGGGGLEDLIVFSDEKIVRAFSNSKMLIVSAIGHETDSPLCDFAADLHVSTPTQAISMVVKKREDLCNQLDVLNCNFLKVSKNLLNYKNVELKDLNTRLAFALSNFVFNEREGLNKLRARFNLALIDLKSKREAEYSKASSSFLSAARTYLFRQSLACSEMEKRREELSTRLARALRGVVDKASAEKKNLDLSFAKILRSHTRLEQSRYEHLKNTLDSIKLNFQKACTGYLFGKEQELTSLSHRLEMTGEDSVLARGYSIIFDRNGNIVSRVEDVHEDEYSIRLSNGIVKVSIREVKST